MTSRANHHTNRTPSQPLKAQLPIATHSLKMTNVGGHPSIIAYKQELWKLMFGTVTGKMEGQDPISPLLCLRPDFMGAGKGNGKINICSELLKLSRLYLLTLGTITVDQIQYDEIDELNLQNATEINNQTEDICCHENEDIKLYSTNNTPDQRHQVFELDTTGTPSKPVEYKLNNKTLRLFKILTALEISYRTEIYKPKEYRLNVDPHIFYCKNLFLKDRKGRFFLVICHEDQDIDLKKLRKTLNAYRNFNFSTTDDMNNLLGVEPGSVTPFALMTEQSAEVTMVICKSLLKEGSTVMFHPLDSTLATEVTMTDLLRFLKHFNHPVFVVKSN